MLERLFRTAAVYAANRRLVGKTGFGTFRPFSSNVVNGSFSSKTRHDCLPGFIPEHAVSDTAKLRTLAFGRSVTKSDAVAVAEKPCARSLALNIPEGLRSALGVMIDPPSNKALHFSVGGNQVVDTLDADPEHARGSCTAIRSCRGRHRDRQRGRPFAVIARPATPTNASPCACRCTPTRGRLCCRSGSGSWGQRLKRCLHEIGRCIVGDIHQHAVQTNQYRERCALGIAIFGTNDQFDKLIRSSMLFHAEFGALSITLAGMNFGGAGDPRHNRVCCKSLATKPIFSSSLQCRRRTAPENIVT